MFYTIYKTTNKINGKIYVGAHKTHDLDDGYLGSGKILGYAIEKYGVENFEKEILAVFDNKKDMFEMESELVNEDFINSDDTYNLKTGGEGGWDYINQICGNQGERLNKSLSKEKRALGYKNSLKKRTDLNYIDIYKENLSNGLKKYYQNHDGTFKGKKHTEESKRKIGYANSKAQKGSGNSQYGTMWIHNLELKESKRIKKTDPIPEGWIKGRKIKF